MNKLLVIVLVTFVFSSACRSRRKAAVTTVPSSTEKLDAKEASAFLASAQNALFSFNYLSAKARMNIENGGKSNNVSLNLRMKQDEKIWISVSALGAIEVARVLLTPDSVKLIDKINNKYIARDYDFVSEALKNDVDFFTIQAMLTGNYKAEDVKKSSSLAKAGGNYVAKGKMNDVNYTYGFTPLFKLSSAEFSDEVLRQKLNISYDDFRTVGDKLFPYLINSSAVSEKESVKLNIQFSKVEKTDKLDFPFSTPKNLD